MSLNIYISDSCGNMIDFWQTPTHATMNVMEKAIGNSIKEEDLKAIDLLEEWALDEFGPKPLNGKDARNPYLKEKYNQEIQIIKIKFDHIREIIEKNTNGKRLVGYI